MSKPEAASGQIDGANALLRSLEREGVDVMFGMPGGAILPVYDPLIDSSIRHVLVRHEQGAGHMAEGYAHATGRPGVCMVTSGPAATNIVTPLCDAYMDSIPMVAITGQVSRAAIGTDAFQECDTTGITMPVTKHNFLVQDPAEIPQVVHDAFHLASTGRPGPVLIDLPKDIINPNDPNSYFENYIPTGHDLPGYNPEITLDEGLIEKAARLMSEAVRPVLYTGGGILKARAAEALLELAELTEIPVITTLMNRGGFPDRHPLNLGMPGMHGNFTAVNAMQEADLIVALGARFDDRVTGKLDAFAPHARIIHVDIDPAELDKVRRAEIGIQGDARKVIEAMTAAIKDLGGLEAQADRSEWRSGLSGWQEKHPIVIEPTRDGKRLSPHRVIEQLSKNTPEDAIIASGVGQHQMLASQIYEFNQPYTWINSGGLGTMGFSVPAAIGAKAGMPDRDVWAIDGDGCFQMTCTELITAAVENIPVKVALLNNNWLGMVRQWQELFYDERFSETHFGPVVPDYKMMAESMGCVAIRVESEEEIVPAIERANEIDDRPVVIEFRTDPAANVYPMVPAGVGNSDLVVHPSQRES